MLALIWITFAISLIIIVISLIMSPDSNSFSGALVGSSDLDLFKVSKERGTKKFIKWAMFVFGISIMIGSVLARIYI